MHAYAHLNRIHRLRIDFSTTANAFEELLKKQAQNPTNDRLRQIITFVFFLRLGYVPCSCQKQQSRRPHQPVLSPAPAPASTKPPAPVPTAAALRRAGGETILRCRLPECRPQQVLCGASTLTQNIVKMSVRQQVPSARCVCRRNRTAPSCHLQRTR